MTPKPWYASKTIWVNLLLYLATMVLGALAAALATLLVQLNGTDAIVWRPILAAALGPIVTGLLAMKLTKAGREDIGALVSRLGTTQATAALEVEAVKQATGLPPTAAPVPDLAIQIADELERRMRAEAAP